MNIALIPAKSFSRRIPNKNFMDFCDKPLVLWSIDQALDSKLIDKVVVSTDSNYFRGSLPMSTKRINLDRPKSLCTDTTTQEEVIAHAIEVLNLNGNDNIVLLQPTSPLRLPGDIDNCIKRQTSFSLNSVISVTNDNEPFFFDQKGYRYELDGTAQRENGSIYVIPIRSFKAWKSRYSKEAIFNLLYPMAKWQQFEIDEPEDIPIVECMFKRYILKEA